MNTERNKKDSGVKPADALGQLSERTRASRMSVAIIAVVGFFVGAFLIGLLVQTITHGSNAPDIPKVEL